MRKPSDLVLAGILAVVLSFALFGNGISGDFVFDDTIVIVGNPLIGDISKFGEIFNTPYFAYQPRPGLYRPLTIASYSLSAFIFGTSPTSFHVINILLHALASFLVFVLIYRLSDIARRTSKIAAYVSFLLFMFLPIHTEAITSIVGRAEILSFIFVVGALLASLRKRYIIASGLFFLGLLSKEMALAFLPIFLFLEFGLAKSKKWWLRKSIYLTPFVPLVLYGILRYIALGDYFLKNDATAIYNPIKFAPFFTGLWTSFKIFYLYIQKTFVPTSLSIDYSFNQIPIVQNLFQSSEAMLGLGILALFVLLFFKTKDFLLKFGILIFLASYFIVSNWVFKTGTIMAERLMYTPSLGLVILITALFLKFPDRTGKILNLKLFYICLAVLFTWYGFLIIDRNKDWRDNKSLYANAHDVAPNSVVNKTNKAYLDFVDGKYPEAEARLNEVLKETPDHVPALNLAAQNYKKLGQFQKAEELWKKAIKLRDDYLRAYLSLGILYYENGYFQSAGVVLTESINIYPRWTEVLFLSLTKISLDKPDEAIELIHKYFGDDPPQKQLKFALGLAYFRKGDEEMAYKYFNQTKDPKMSMDDFVKTFENSKVILLGEF